MDEPEFEDFEEFDSEVEDFSLAGGMDLQDAAIRAFQRVLHETSGDGVQSPAFRGSVTAVYAAVKVVGDDGDQYLVTVIPPNTPLWEDLGVIEYLRAVFRVT